MITKEDFLEWQQSEVTQEMYKEYKNWVEELTEMLVVEAGMNQNSDIHTVACISVLRDVLSWNPVESEDSQPKGEL